MVMLGLSFSIWRDSSLGISELGNRSPTNLRKFGRGTPSQDTDVVATLRLVTEVGNEDGSVRECEVKVKEVRDDGSSSIQ